MVVTFVPISAGLTSFMIYILLDTIKGRLLITNDKMVRVGVFKTQELRRGDVEGFRVSRNYIHIISSSDKLPELKVSSYYSSGLKNWLYNNYKDLDVLDEIQSEIEILSSEEFGFTPEQREQKLIEARRLCRKINLGGVLIGFWLIFYPRPYSIVTGFAILIPLLAIFALHIYKGIIKIDQKYTSSYPSITIGLMLPSLALAFRSIIDFDLLGYYGVWFPVLTITAVLCLGVFSSIKEFKFDSDADYLIAFSIPVILIAFAYGTVVNINCFYDNSMPTNFQSKILSKRISSGSKLTSFYLELEPWGPRETIEEVSVLQSVYSQVEVGTDANILLFGGNLGIPWFYVWVEQ